jgi:hypothetical protein
MAETGAREIPEEALAPPAATDGGIKAFHVGRREFKKWFDAPDGDFVMGNLPPHIRELLGAKSDALIFSQETLAKQKNNHPGISAKDYVSVLNGIPACGEIYRTRDHHIGLVVKSRKTWAVVIKTTRDGAESYMVSLHRLRDHSLIQVQKLTRIL